MLGYYITSFCILDNIWKHLKCKNKNKLISLRCNNFCSLYSCNKISIFTYKKMHFSLFFREYCHRRCPLWQSDYWRHWPRVWLVHSYGAGDSVWGDESCWLATEEDNYVYVLGCIRLWKYWVMGVCTG